MSTFHLDYDVHNSITIIKYSVQFLFICFIVYFILQYKLNNKYINMYGIIKY